MTAELKVATTAVNLVESSAAESADWRAVRTESMSVARLAALSAESSAVQTVACWVVLRAVQMAVQMAER